MNIFFNFVKNLNKKIHVESRFKWIHGNPIHTKHKLTFEQYAKGINHIKDLGPF